MTSAENQNLICTSIEGTKYIKVFRDHFEYLFEPYQYYRSSGGYMLFGVIRKSFNNGVEVQEDKNREIELNVEFVSRLEKTDLSFIPHDEKRYSSTAIDYEDICPKRRRGSIMDN